ncbi:Solute carrier family 22 member 7 [Merluccius polli]|uniref:Solute carrier family 22 member 6 n=1 Tax=Merluccius polli TaxID=89951 RepID=A0AA47NUX1_MERPO|nr:Solute carrier family 22 member 7 [Merluccius polli]
MHFCTDLWVIRTIVAVCGKGLSEGSFTIMFLYTAELYPTVVRQNGMGYTSFVARLGVSLAPLVFLLEDVWRLLPAVIYCMAAIVSGGVALLLPETKNARMPELIEDVEKPRRPVLGLVRFRRSTMKFENILEDINGFGRFQKMMVVISFISRFSMPCHFILNNFIAVVPSHHCDLTSLDVDGTAFRNITLEQNVIVGVPMQEDGKPSSCLMYKEPQYHLLLGDSNGSRPQTVPCQTGWVFDNSTFKSTLATEWNLVCDQKGKDKNTGTIFFVGVMCGAVGFGSLSDRFGRRMMLLLSYVLAALFGMASAFSSSFVMFAVLRFFTGFSISGIVIISTVLNVEWVDIRSRKLVAVIDSLSWSFGTIVFPAIAYFVRDWRLLIISVTSPLALAIIIWRWVPESARWLVANGKLEEAQKYLRRCAKMNQTQEFAQTLTTEVSVAETPGQLPSVIVHSHSDSMATRDMLRGSRTGGHRGLLYFSKQLDQPRVAQALSMVVMNEKKDRVYTYLDLVRTPVIRKLAIRTAIVWFCVACTYYGISFDIGGFGLDIYLTQFTYGLVELPAKFFVYHLLDKIGRRRTAGGALFCVAICLLINILLPKEMSTIRTVVAILGKGFSSATFATVVLYTSELYPTVVRQNGMGFNSSISRTAVAVTPLILLLEDVWHSLPKVIFCSVATVGAAVLWTLPETRDRCLLETIEDIEAQGGGGRREDAAL